MKISQILCKHHIGWHFRKHWQVQSKRTPILTDALKVLRSKGVAIYTPEDILKEERILEKVDVIGYMDKPVVFDETHPDWHKKPLLHFKDENVLLEGLNQAKTLTRTIELQDGLPKSLELKDISREKEIFAKQIVKSCQLFDAEQVKLPKIKDPNRPYHTFARVYGISQNRRNFLIVSKLLQLIESTSDQHLSQDRYLFSDLLFSYPFEANGQQIQFQLTGDFFLSSCKSLKVLTQESTEDVDIHDMTPLAKTVSLSKQNIYKIENIYPIKSLVQKKHPHTIFVFFNREEVKNQFEEPVTDSQIFGRSLLKAFTVAASYAKQTYGTELKTLPDPVTVQCVQTDGKMFHFGIFQLNTLDLEADVVKNIWYQTPFLHLFDNCSYNLGKPLLEGYNSEILKHLYAFYNNV